MEFPATRIEAWRWLNDGTKSGSLLKHALAVEVILLAFVLPLSTASAAASGWIGFYWGKTLEECRRGKTIPDSMMAGWLEYFQKQAREP